ncbi:hypothetical protein [Glycomyces tenuis]|uniref:hypothetical protein n=1 Tax=Glycomyces tenuis TaxID=58116 RepID=UPI0004284979|nr:hypothetical protein [Glycomyces tenuis]
MTATMASTPARVRRLQLTVGLCSVVFTLGTALHNFVIIDVSVIEEMMRSAGGADPGGEAPGFTAGFRAVGSVYIAANAVGILALWFRPRWLYWWVLAVNVTQGLGWVMIPTQMWSVVADHYGPAGTLPSAVTDGGAVLLSVVMIVALIRCRGVWGGGAVADRP